MNETLIDRLFDLIADVQELEGQEDIPEAIANALTRARWILEDAANGENQSGLGGA